MSMYSQLDAIDLVLRKDEKLLRLLYYKSDNFTDDVLIETEERPDVLSRDDKYDIINHRLKFTPTTRDFASIQICRIIFYPSPRRPQGGSYAISDQQVNFDIFVHRDYNDIDMRLSKICDRINDLFSNQKITPLGKARFVNGKPFTLSDEGYIGYTMTYSFGSVN